MKKVAREVVDVLDFDLTGEESVGIKKKHNNNKAVDTDEKKEVKEKVKKDDGLTVTRTASSSAHDAGQTPIANMAIFLDKDVSDTFKSSVKGISLSAGVKSILAQYLKNQELYFKSDDELLKMCASDIANSDRLLSFEELAESQNVNNDEKVRTIFCIPSDIKGAIKERAISLGLGKRGASKLVNAILKSYLIKMGYMADKGEQ